MNSSTSGTNISTSKDNAEITAITRHGFWILIEDQEHFVPFADYRQFRRASIEEIYHFIYHPAGHLHWPELDIDIELEALEHPKRYPLAFTGPEERNSDH